MGVSVPLLLASALLSSYTTARTGADAQNLFTIRSISLSLSPAEDVERDTNVTVRCSAVVSSLGQRSLSREYTIYKDGITVYSKTSSSTEDLLYPLSQARVSHTGKYRCKVSIEGRSLSSEARRLTVRGLSAPVLLVEQTLLSEGQEVRARCTAPGESGSIIFYFYEDLNEVREERVNVDRAEVSFPVSGPGLHSLQCSFTVLIPPDSITSERSSPVHVSVRELSIVPVLDIFPQDRVYEGDQLTLSCGLSEVHERSEQVHVYLSQGTTLLQSANTYLNHTLTLSAQDQTQDQIQDQIQDQTQDQTQDPAEFECRLEMGNVVKVETKTVPVTELFSVPTLTMSPVEVFQKEPMKLICRSETFASERLSREDLSYAIDPPSLHLVERSSGVFSGRALALDFNYTCLARAKGVVKQSRTLTVKPKVSVSVPKISIVDKAIVGRPFKIRCKSDNGSLPINYTLLLDYAPVSSFTVRSATEEALFNVTVHRPRDVRKFICEASNSRREGLLSLKLDATVIEPVSQPLLTVIPSLSEISEGSDLIFICSIVGTPPVTFKVYRHGYELPVFTRTSAENNTSFEIHGLLRDHSGTYYFEAFNHANNIVSSEPVQIEVRLALWKKILIGGFCLLGLSVLLVASVLFFKSHRGKGERASELSVKPAWPNSEESLSVNLTHNTEVYEAPTDAVPGYEGFEGREATIPAHGNNSSRVGVSAAI